MLIFEGISTFIKVVLYVFAPALTVSRILTFHIFYLQKVGQGHGVQLSQCQNLQATLLCFLSSLRYDMCEQL